MKNFIQSGEVMTYTVPSSTTIEAGDVVKKGNLIGIAVSGGTEDDEIAVNLTGAYELTKKSALAVTQGDALYWDEDDEEITKTAADGVLIGHALESAGGSDETVIVLLGAGGGGGAIPNQAAVVAALTGSMTGTTDGAMADVTALSTAGGNTYSDSAVNLKIDMVNTNLKELQTKVNAILTALKDADIMASA